MLPIVLSVLAGIFLAVLAFYLIPSVRRLFSDSETVLLSALPALVGAILGLLSVVDPNLLAPFLNDRQMSVVLLVTGAVTYLARRFRAEDL